MRTLSVLLAAGLVAMAAAPAAQAKGSDPGYVLTDFAGAPIHGTNVPSPTVVRFTAPPGVTITKVKYLIDNVYVAEVTTAPWELATYITPGTRTIKARATTSAGDRQATATVTATLTPLPAAPPELPEPVGPWRIVNVSTVAELGDAITDAHPGDVINLADGTYPTNGLTAIASGTPEQPIVLTGGPGAVITSDDGYDGGSAALRLAGVGWWRLDGFTINNAKKGLILDESHHVLVEGLAVHDIGHEGIHLRRHTSHCWIVGNVVYNTGKANQGFGEGIYVGSAVSNWEVYTNGQPDRSDYNTIIGNDIWGTTAESIDIKEGTTGGVVAANTFRGPFSGDNSADSYIDVKGNAWRIRDNHGEDSNGPGIEIHVAARGWGAGNWITYNYLQVATAGIQMVPDAVPLGNIVGCDNTVTGGPLVRTTSGTTLPCQP